MSRLEYVSPEGLRLDGRRPTELRHIHAELGLFSRADGSAYLQQGNTKVLVAVYGPREVVKGKALHDRAIVNCEFRLATFSSGERRQKSTGSRQTAEASLIIRQAFESVIQLHLFPKSQIDIYVQVLQADGGVLCTAVNASTLAMIDAGIPIRDFVCACTVSYIHSTPLLDINYVEDTANGALLSLAILPNSGNVCIMQMDNKLPFDEFEQVLKLAFNGCSGVHQELRSIVVDHTLKLAQSRGLTK